MSAFIVCKNHIDVLVKYANLYNVWVSYGNPSKLFKCDDDLDRTGQVLYNENVRSYNYRYPHAQEDTIEEYHWNINTRSRGPVEVLKACNCYLYQTCETPGYKDTIAWKIVEAIKEHAIELLPGYNEAQWECVI